jgi:pimeloyl-ACP methyl ester carboxylesterase
MVAALRSFLALHSYRRLVLIGYSGGGTIAWLMAASLPETTMVVTVAANLDTDGWARIHGYSALEGSLNPALLPELRPAIVQLHYVGGRDRNVPPSIVRAFARHHPRARVVEIADFDHVCCWIERWPRLLAEPATSLMPTAFAHDTCRPTSGIASTVAILSERLSCRVGSMMPKRAIEERAPSRPALLARSRPGSVCGSIAARSNHAGATDGANG